LLDVRGKGLFTAIEVNEGAHVNAWDMCLDLLKEGVLCKPTHKTKIRFTPPLILNEKQVDHLASIFSKVVSKY
jgi:ornithine--oxo-acid transaminase